jgi:hypothetical protein
LNVNGKGKKTSIFCSLHGQNKQRCMQQDDKTRLYNTKLVGNMKLLLQNILRTTCKMEFEIAQEIADLTTEIFKYTYKKYVISRQNERFRPYFRSQIFVSSWRTYSTFVLHLSKL